VNQREKNNAGNVSRLIAAKLPSKDEALADRGEYCQAAGIAAEAVIRSVELIVQPDAKDGVGEMRACGPPASPAGT